MLWDSSPKRKPPTPANNSIVLITINLINLGLGNYSLNSPKDQFGNDIPFDVSYIANSEGNTIVRSVIPTEESNDSVRKITIPFNYFPGQRIVTIHGTHFEGFPYSLENVPELKNTIGFDSGWWIGNPNLQLDSEGNIIVRHGKDGGSFKKYNTDGKN